MIAWMHTLIMPMFAQRNYKIGGGKDLMPLYLISKKHICKFMCTTHYCRSKQSFIKDLTRIGFGLNVASVIMKATVNTVLAKNEIIQQATSAYIDDILMKMWHLQLV